MQTLFNQIETYVDAEPGAEMFALWRAVLSLVHVDDDIAAMEDYLVESITQVFKFSEDQKEQIEKDMKARPDPKVLFQDIKTQACKAQFFRLARIVIWCDGILHEDELEIVDGIKDSLGDEIADYESDLRWMRRKPDLPIGETAESSEEEVMKHILFQMIAFYEGQI